MVKQGYVYNIVGFVHRDRVMKETITATSVAQAREIAVYLLRRRGFNPSQVRIEVIKL
jgi:hypothetical protein